ncbi:hypothetical protein V6N11_049728 [Hibiscus sabdariffa]|uniref:Uncharacterized protein n=1 Tax=Hibiscus sabdariffa TaxID=183260 RepID=A0ABR2T7U0_9ROSI
MINLNGDWDWDRFQDFLPSTVLLAIGAVKPPSNSISDVIGWGGDDRLQFSIKAVYLMRAGIEERAEEDLSHLFRDCVETRMSWPLVIKLEKLHEFHTLELRTWLHVNLSN